MANLRTIQFLRSSTIYTDLAAAKLALEAQADGLADGSPIVGRYMSGGTELSVFGIVHSNDSGTGVTFFESAEDIADKIKQLQDELDAAEAAVGLASGGTHVSQEGKYISGASTVEQEIVALNEQLVILEGLLDGLDAGPIGGTDASVITQIQQTDGKISGLSSNVGALLLTDYTKGSDSGAVAATDSINAAFGKVENQIDAVNGVIAALDAGTVSGDSKVVIDVTQEDGQITATAANLTGVKLDGYAEAAATGDVATTDTLGEALGKLQKNIHEMDKTASSADGQVVITVSETDGVVSEEKANVKDLQLGGYQRDNSTGAILSADTINVALSKLENQIGSNTVTNADGSITVTTGNGSTDVAVHIKSGERVIKLDASSGGIYTNLNLVKITESLPAEIKERYELRDSDNVKIGDSIDVPKDSHIVSITYITDSGDTHYQNLEYNYIDVSGNTKTEYVDMSALVLDVEFASGVTATNGVAHGVVDPTSEGFLTVGADGFKLSGVQDAIDTAISGLDVSDSAVAGQYVTTVSETDGKISVSRADVSSAVLNNYSKGSDATAVAETDTVNQAIGKLENQVDAAKAAATTKVVEGTDAGNNMEISATTGADGSVTYTINLTDVASDSALTAEIAARKAVDGQNGDTYAANTSAKYISGAADLNDADVKLDAAIYELSGKTFTEAGSANNSITFTESTAADGTTHIDAQTDASQISGLTAVSPIPVDDNTSTSGVSTTDSVQTGINNLYASLAAEIAARKAAISATSVVGSDAITVTESASGDTISLKLDGTTIGDGDEKTGNDNALTITEGQGLFLSTKWDCGTFGA